MCGTVLVAYITYSAVQLNPDEDCNPGSDRDNWSEETYGLGPLLIGNFIDVCGDMIVYIVVCSDMNVYVIYSNVCCVCSNVYVLLLLGLVFSCGSICYISVMSSHRITALLTTGALQPGMLSYRYKHVDVCYITMQACTCRCTSCSNRRKYSGYRGWSIWILARLKAQTSILYIFSNYRICVDFFLCWYVWYRLCMIVHLVIVYFYVCSCAVYYIT